MSQPGLDRMHDLRRHPVLPPGGFRQETADRLAGLLEEQATTRRIFYCDSIVSPWIASKSRRLFVRSVRS